MLYTALLIAVTIVGASFVILPPDRLSSPDSFDWPDDWATASVAPASFRDGDGGPYSETDDVYIISNDPDKNFGTNTKLFVDGAGCKTSPSSVCKTLIKFPDFIGPNSGQVPPESTIISASLDLI